MEPRPGGGQRRIGGVPVGHLTSVASCSPAPSTAPSPTSIRCATSRTSHPVGRRTQPWPPWADPDVVAAFVDRGITAAVVPPDRRRRRCPLGPSRRAQHRHRVGQVAGLPTADSHGHGGRSARAGAVPVADEGARSRPAARRAVADRRRRRTRQRRARARTTATAAPRHVDSPARTRAGSSPTPT